MDGRLKAGGAWLLGGRFKPEPFFLLHMRTGVTGVQAWCRCAGVQVCRCAGVQASNSHQKIIFELLCNAFRTL